jgi:hypothetical protein
MPQQRERVITTKQITLCVDFDGVIHSYSSGWKGATEITDPPIEGAFTWLEELTRHFKVCIYSSRSSQLEGIKAMQAWFKKHAGEVLWVDMLEFPTQKPAAYLTIDDRAICFKGPGTYPSVNEILEFKPWFKK